MAYAVNLEAVYEIPNEKETVVLCEERIPQCVAERVFFPFQWSEACLAKHGWIIS